MNQTNSANEWMLADPARVETWKRVAQDCVMAASYMVGVDIKGVATWMLACHLRVRYSTGEGPSSMADIAWDEVASQIVVGLASGTDA